MKSLRLYSAIARTCQWLHNLENAEDGAKATYLPIAERRLSSLEKLLPSGSGIYNTRIVSDKSSNSRVEINFMYQHMDENGYYSGVSGYRTVIKPCLSFDFAISIFGSNKNQEKDYFYDIFDDALNELVVLNSDEEYIYC